MIFEKLVYETQNSLILIKNSSNNSREQRSEIIIFSALTLDNEETSVKLKSSTSAIEVVDGRSEKVAFGTQILQHESYNLNYKNSEKVVFETQIFQHGSYNLSYESSEKVVFGAQIPQHGPYNLSYESLRKSLTGAKVS